MKKRVMMMAAVMAMAGVMSGCSGSKPAETTAAPTAAAETTAAETTAAPETTAAETQSPAAEEEILVAAAASLKNAYEDKLIPMFQEANPGITGKGTYDSSGKLQTQIEEGLEADVFMSAATKQMTALDEGGYIVSETIVNLLENKIVLIVPAGQYAEEALTNLGIWDSIQEKVSLGTNVTEVLNQVAAASADAGIVYATDAASMADQVTVIAEAPEGSLAKRVIYPVAVIKNTAHADAANAFVEFLQSDDAMAVFESYGFAKGN